MEDQLGSAAECDSTIQLPGAEVCRSSRNNLSIEPYCTLALRRHAAAQTLGASVIKMGSQLPGAQTNEKTEEVP
jgi:hypothetical protein